MIKFFNRIRRDLLKEGKTAKYLKYAVGEIVLVVIGILIALGINQKANFNNDRKTEVTILKEIRINLLSDLTEITDDINYMDTTDAACDIVKDLLETNDVPTREFGANSLKMRTTPHFNPNKSGYKLLESKGVEIIQNDSLRRAISDHYESLYTYYAKYEQERIEFRILFIEPNLTKRFNWVPKPDTPFLGTFQIDQDDFIKLKNDDDFKNLITAIKRENNLVQNRANRVKQNIIALSAFLEKELKTK